MSVSTGTPNSSLTRRRMPKPSSSPGPRKLSMAERLALSKDDLKTKSSPAARARSLQACAIINACSRDSMTHGPAIKDRRPSPNVALPTLNARISAAPPSLFIVCLSSQDAFQRASTNFSFLLLNQVDCNRSNPERPYKQVKYSFFFPVGDICNSVGQRPTKTRAASIPTLKGSSLNSATPSGSNTFGVACTGGDAPGYYMGRLQRPQKH